VVAARRGRVVKSMGDGWIVTFGSVSDGVTCAMQAQNRLKIDGGMQLRIGVHIGDVAEADDDVFGEGVNIAGRLQEIAEPGAVVAVSDPVYSLLDGTLRPSFDDAGERALKNIPRPLRVWSRGGEVAGQAAGLKERGFPELAIRPVKTSDKRLEVQHLAAALTGDMAFHLDGFRFLSARVSQASGSRGYELTTSLRASGSRLRLEARLVAPGGITVDVRKIDGDPEDVFDWQDDVAAELSGSILRSIIRAEADRADALPEVQRRAEHWQFLGMARQSLDLPGFLYSLDCLDRATALEPNDGFIHAQALTQIVSALSLGYGPFLGAFADRFDKWSAAVDRLEPSHSPSRILLAFSQLVLRGGDATLVRPEIRALTRQLPFDPELLHWTGWLHLYLGEPDTALEHLKRINLKTSPYYVSSYPSRCDRVCLSATPAARSGHALPGKTPRAEPAISGGAVLSRFGMWSSGPVGRGRRLYRQIPAGRS
jgi:adenylate cyclase